MALYNSGGFEAGAGFNLGDLHRQTPNQPQGWVRDVPANADGTGGIPAAVVATPNGDPGTYGSQVVSYDRGTGETDTTWSPGIDNVQQGNQGVVTASWDMELSSAGIVGTPFFGLELNDYYQGARIAYAGVQANRSGNATLIVDNGSTSSAPGSFLNTNVPVSLDVWHHYTVTMDFALQTYMVYFDGTPEATQSFEYTNNGGPLTQFSDASLASFDPGAASGVAGQAYYDNYTLNDSLPEPSVLGSVAAIGLCFGCRRRSRSSIAGSYVVGANAFPATLRTASLLN